MKKSLALDTSKLVVYIAQEVINTLISHQQIKADSHEVAGVFVGEIYPEEHTIIIKKAIVTHEENGSRYNVNLDIKKLQRMIDQEWLKSGKTLLYLGEWHTHPEPFPSPSLTDYLTFSGNYFTSRFAQNILIYTIIGVEKDTFSSMWIRTYNGLLFRKVNVFIL